LIITDTENEKIISKKLSEHLYSLGLGDEEVKKVISEKVKIDHFGNLIGVNTYRDFSNVVVMKTPNYDYLSYALTFFYYSSKEGNKLGKIEVFQHEQINKIWKTSVAGEIYQAVKRVNRDNSRNSEIYVFTANQEAINIVLEQLPGINYKQMEMEGVYKKKQRQNKKSTKSDSKAKELKDFLIECINNGRDSIQKKELRNRIGEKDAGNFKKILNKIKPFLIEHNFDFETNSRYIYLNNN
jgi:hypothetical protein